MGMNRRPHRPHAAPVMSDELRIYLRYIVRSLDDIRSTLYAFASEDRAAIQAMLIKLKKSDDALDKAVKDALTHK